jgi:hypothetical protein
VDCARAKGGPRIGSAFLGAFNASRVVSSKPEYGEALLLGVLPLA